MRRIARDASDAALRQDAGFRVADRAALRSQLSHGGVEVVHLESEREHPLAPLRNMAGDAMVVRGRPHQLQERAVAVPVAHRQEGQLHVGALRPDGRLRAQAEQLPPGVDRGRRVRHGEDEVVETLHMAGARWAVVRERARSMHQLGEHALEGARVEEGDGTRHPLAGRLVDEPNALRLQVSQRGLDVGHLETDVVQPFAPTLQKTRDAGVGCDRLQQLQEAIA